MKKATTIAAILFCLFVPAVHAQEAEAPAFEQLDSHAVQFDVDRIENYSFAIFRSLDHLLEYLSDRYYSLLDWRIKPQRDLQAPKYKRLDHFGRWVKDPTSKTCFNTRGLVLIRDSEGHVTLDDANNCSVESGVWNDDYTGQTFRSRDEVQIDHVVPLKNAYISGAFNWNFKSRCLYANYLGNRFHLKSVNARENMRKGDRSPDQYMPPNERHACSYLKNWLTIKFLWGLKMKVEEAQFISQALRNYGCNLSMYKISQREIQKQIEYAHEHSQICDSITPASAD